MRFQMKGFLGLVVALGTLIGGTSGAWAAFGAIAFSPSTGAYGYSHGASSQAKAEQTAARHCKARASDCRIIVFVKNGCAALAVGKGNRYGYGWTDTRPKAENRAMSECKSRTSGCKIRSWVCSG